MYIVTCPDCGDLQLPQAAVQIRFCVDDATWSYWFICPGCEQRSAYAVRDQVTSDALASTVVEADDWRLPAELTEPRPEGPAFSPADLVAFSHLLDSVDWPAQL